MIYRRRRIAAFLGRSVFRNVVAVAGVVLVGGCHTHNGQPPIITPHEMTVSEALPTQSIRGAAVWQHPTNPSASILLVPNAERGLQVHSFNGTLVQHISSVFRTTSVGVIYNFSNHGKTTDLAVVAHSRYADSLDKGGGVSLFSIDPSSNLSDKPVNEKLIDTFADDAGGHAASLICAYRSHVTGRRFFFAIMRDGRVEQWEIVAKDDQTIGATMTRAFNVGGEILSATSDDDAGVVYLSDKSTGIRQFNAEPQMPLDTHVAIPRSAGNNERANSSTLVEPGAMTIYSAAGGQGYILVTNRAGPRGQTRIDLYDRMGDHPFVATISLPPTKGMPVSRTSGLVVTNSETDPMFPLGVLCVADSVETDGSPTFRMYSWAEIAKSAGLLIDPEWSPRPVLYRR